MNALSQLPALVDANQTQALLGQSARPWEIYRDEQTPSQDEDPFEGFADGAGI
jgi:hypothetical protein